MAGLLQQASMMGLYLQRSADESERLASIDPLTGVANRRAFERTCEVEVRRARRQGTPVSLLALDIDHFKSINDRWGHGAGDKVLRAVTDTVQLVLRATDTVARVGGEEFVVLLPGTPIEGALALGERIRRQVELLEWDSVLEPAARVTVSIGVSAWRPDEPSLEAAAARADELLYRAKVAGRNRVVCGPDVMPAAV
jgi:diguanylate cyclase (GGDEF)-like protein